MIEEINWIYLEFLVTVSPMTNGRLSRFGNRVRAIYYQEDNCGLCLD
jgi:hypothetical protein